jgi:diacylglycerol kinase (ATP)
MELNKRTMIRSTFSLKNRLKSFRNASMGLKMLIVEEHNARIHLFAAIVALILGVFFKVSTFEWIVIILSIGLVISVEAINSSIERIADFISPEYNDKIKSIKDISAASVLICAFTVLLIGCIVFIPKIIELC